MFVRIKESILKQKTCYCKSDLISKCGRGGKELAVTIGRYQVKKATSYEGKGLYKQPGIIICGIAWSKFLNLEFC